MNLAMQQSLRWSREKFAPSPAPFLPSATMLAAQPILLHPPFVDFPAQRLDLVGGCYALASHERWVPELRV
jgi:hypothetical protein